jgi:4-hydroxy-tetrahydrodipicolinate synthase
LLALSQPVPIGLAQEGPPAPLKVCPWAGVYPTVVTPFGPHGVDTRALKRQLDLQLRGGVQGLLVLGTIGEGRFASPEERAQVIATAVQAAGARVPVVVGIHTCELTEAQAQLRQARELGARAVLVKYTGRPAATVAEVFSFYAGLAEGGALPIFYYHHPAETGLKLAAHEVARILSLEGVVGIKETTLDLREVKAHMHFVADPSKAFLTCTALNLTQFLDLGGHGAMCPEAVLMPDTVVQAYSCYQAGQGAAARELQKHLFVLEPLLSDSKLPTGIVRTAFMTAQDHGVALPLGDVQPQARLKCALTCMGVPTPPTVRGPLPGLNDGDRCKVNVVVGKIKCFDCRDIIRQYPPVPLKPYCRDDDQTGGIILKTGGIQLGRDVGKDMRGWQWDGRFGFWD